MTKASYCICWWTPWDVVESSEKNNKLTDFESKSFLWNHKHYLLAQLHKTVYNPHQLRRQQPSLFLPCSLSKSTIRIFSMTKRSMLGICWRKTGINALVFLFLFLPAAEALCAHSQNGSWAFFIFSSFTKCWKRVICAISISLLWDSGKSRVWTETFVEIETCVSWDKND